MGEENVMSIHNEGESSQGSLICTTCSKSTVTKTESGKYWCSWCSQWTLPSNWEPSDNHERAIMLVAVGKWDEVVELGAVAVNSLVASLNNSNTNVRQS